jgi:hypothetical protein
MPAEMESTGNKTSVVIMLNGVHEDASFDIPGQLRTAAHSAHFKIQVPRSA